MQIDLDKLDPEKRKQVAEVLGLELTKSNKKDTAKTPGTFRKRGKDTYQLRYRGQNTTVIAKDDYQAEKALAKFIADVDRGRFKPPSKITVRELSTRFLRDNPDISEDTKDNYKIHLDNRILPVFGDMKIDKVTPKNIYDFYDYLKKDGIRKDGKPGGLGSATIQKHHHIISAMFSFAVDNLKELEENPCDHVKPPKIPKRKPVSMEKDPAINLLRALVNESLKYRVMTVIAACTGMRRGEILGIGDSTLDLENPAIKISGASRHGKGEIRIKDPKTGTSVRAVPLPQAVVPLIKELIEARNKQREKCGDKWVNQVNVHGQLVDNDLLFTQWNGKPMHPNSVDSWFSKFRETNELPKNLTFHGLRHTNITLLLKSGVDIGTVADNAGHAKKSTTLDYDDPSAEALREVATKIDNVLSLPEVVPELLGKPVNKPRKKKGTA